MLTPTSEGILTTEMERWSTGMEEWWGQSLVETVAPLLQHSSLPILQSPRLATQELDSEYQIAARVARLAELPSGADRDSLSQSNAFRKGDTPCKDES